MLGHDTCRDDNQNGGYYMYLTPSPPITKHTLPKSNLIHPCEKSTAPYYHRKIYICMKSLGEKVDQVFSYKEFTFIQN